MTHDHFPMNYKSHSYKCSVELSLDIIGGKWKPLILWRLGENEILRFGELRRSLTGITQKMLTQQLRDLEANGLVNRYVYTQVPPKVEYSLTPLGQTIVPILYQLGRWGLEFYIAQKGETALTSACLQELDE